jgi:hypothetical protein
MFFIEYYITASENYFQGKAMCNYNEEKMKRCTDLT